MSADTIQERPLLALVWYAVSDNLTLKICPYWECKQTRSFHFLGTSVISNINFGFLCKTLIYR